VYWDQSLRITKRRFPINVQKEIDYRYVRRIDAITYLVETIKVLDEAHLDSKALRATLATLEKTQSR
jgi:hypothetical protein